MGYLFDEHDIKLIKDGTLVKLWMIAKNLNQILTDTIIQRIIKVVGILLFTVKVSNRPKTLSIMRNEIIGFENNTF